MTDDFVLRALLVSAVAVVALAVGLFSRRGRGFVRRSVTLPGYGPGVYLFTSATCASCDRMREALADHPEVVDVSYEENGDRFPAEIGRVPAIALLDESGSGWVALGIIGKARLDRWLGP